MLQSVNRKFYPYSWWWVYDSFTYDSLNYWTKQFENELPFGMEYLRDLGLDLVFKYCQDNKHVKKVLKLYIKKIRRFVEFKNIWKCE